MGNPYPAQIAIPGGGPVKVAGDLTFTDPANQPGGSLPAEWTVGANGDLTIDASDANASLTVRPAAQPTSRIDCGALDNGDGTGQAFLTVGGTNGGGAAVSVTAGGGSAGTAFLDGRGELQLFTTAGNEAITAWDADGNVLRFALLPAGQPMIGVVAAPADGDIAASQVALWFDDSNGSAKLMLKGKTADGTVVTGSVNLT